MAAIDLFKRKFFLGDMRIYMCVMTSLYHCLDLGKVLLINKRNIPLEVTTLAIIKVYRQSAYTLGRKTIKSTLLKQFEINIHIYITLILP